MIRYLLERLATTLLSLALVGGLVFVLMRSIPGDPVLIMLGDVDNPVAVADMRTRLGLDQPLPVQFVRWAGQMLRGDLGQSIRTQQPVGELILDRFQVTALIVLVAVAIAAAIAVPLGMLAAWKQNRWPDLAVVGTGTALMSIPSFWLGLMLLLVFGLTLEWVPIVGYVPLRDDAVAALKVMALPVATLVLVEAGSIARMARASTVDVLRLEYITHARAKGASEASVLFRHAGPNAFAPTWTLIGLILGNLLGGAAVVETVFTLPGLGRLLVEAIFARDYPVIQGCLMFIAFVYAVVNLLVDLAYPLFDPRVKL
jgi:peptide/nickel transport system permease protein